MMGLEWGGSNHHKPLMTIKLDSVGSTEPIDEISRGISKLSQLRELGKSATKHFFEIPEGTFYNTTFTNEEKSEE